jgi:hypothetical protein
MSLNQGTSTALDPLSDGRKDRGLLSHRAYLPCRRKGVIMQILIKAYL